MPVYKINFISICMVLFFFVSSITPMIPYNSEMTNEQARESVEEIAKDPSRWMQGLRSICPSFNKMPISYWTLMGTHNAATGYMTQDNVLFYGLDLYGLTPDYGKNQGLTIAKQLALGVRYFDMRTYFQDPSTPTGKLYVSLLGDDFGIYCCHEYAVFNHKMAGCLNDVAHFVADREELVILNFSNFFASPSSEDHEKLADMFATILLDKLILPDGSNPNMVPFQELIAKGSVIIFYDDTARKQSKKLLGLTHSDNHVISHWHGRNKKGEGILCQSWPEIETDYLAPYGPAQDQGFLKVLQLHVQPDVKFIIESFLASKTLKTWAKEIEPHIIKLLINPSNQYKINVVQVDYFEPGGLLAAVIYHNFMRSQESSDCCCSLLCGMPSLLRKLWPV